MKFAIVDIETTGSNASDAHITEIAVRVVQDAEVIQAWDSLINPSVSIPANITALTGITNEMVIGMPSFAEIASDLYAVLCDCTFVAHNVNFDYSFIKSAFKKSQISFNTPKLCTVKLVRMAFPGHKSYSLGKICNELKIEIKSRHRAGGDADATVELFNLAKNQITVDQLNSLIIGASHTLHLPPNVDLKEIYQLPLTPGVYYFRDSKNTPLYIGKAKNIRKRVLQHFNSKTGKGALNLELVSKITFKETGSEIMALLEEADEINRFWPKWNEAGKVPKSKFGLFTYKTQLGEMRLQIETSRGGKIPLTPFINKTEASKFLGKLIVSFNLCSERVSASRNCTNPNCYCQLPEKKRIVKHNEAILKAIQSLQSRKEKNIIKGPGRNSTEAALIFLESEKIITWGFAPITELSNIDESKFEPKTQHLGLNKLSKQIARMVLPAAEGEFNIIK